MADAESKTNILIVDDIPSNLQLLVKLLQMEGYRVRPARSGAAAFAILEDVQPDVILLDINMPEMDGFEVCRRLKADPRFRDIPVVFLSALHDTYDKVKAFEVGGMDYITKPVQMEEMRVRIETHLRMARMRAELQEANAKLREGEKQHEMLTHLIAHDMRTPLFGILGMAELITLNPEVQHDPETRDGVANIQDSARILVTLISDMLDVYKSDCGSDLVRPANVLFSEIPAEAIRLLGGIAKRRPFEVRIPAQPYQVFCDRGLTVRLLVNLLVNAFRFTPEGTRISLTAAEEKGFLKVEVSDEGAGIAPEDQGRLFQKFGQLEAKEKGVRYSTGLGLVFCRMVAEAQGGQIGLASAPGQGSTFWFTLPLAKGPERP
ncbi:MAG: hybrid sensor histidine kinase/response regulator [Kiritimatiellia bacterium]